LIVTEEEDFCIGFSLFFVFIFKFDVLINCSLLIVFDLDKDFIFGLLLSNLFDSLIDILMLLGFDYFNFIKDFLFMEELFLFKGFSIFIFIDIF
jgi:hypothetical protein